MDTCKIAASDLWRSVWRPTPLRSVLPAASALGRRPATSLTSCGPWTAAITFRRGRRGEVGQQRPQASQFGTSCSPGNGASPWAGAVGS